MIEISTLDMLGIHALYLLDAYTTCEYNDCEDKNIDTSRKNTESEDNDKHRWFDSKRS